MNKLVVLDVETTGLDKDKDHIIQFSAIKYDRELCEEVDSINLYIQPSIPYSMSISAFMKHGISSEFLKDKPTFKDVANQIYDFMKDCDLLTYNGIACDAQFITAEFRRVGINWSIMDFNIYDALIEERRRNDNRLESAFARYNNMTMEEAGLTAHDALSDVRATLNVFQHQQNNAEYEPEKLLVEDNTLINRVFEKDNKEHISFGIGKYKDIPVQLVAKIDKGYLDWVVNKSSFCSKTKEYVKKYLC